MKLDVLCCGIVVADFICEPVTHLPKAGELVLTGGITWEIGGCAANVATGLARLGVPVGVVGRVGSDAAGRFVRSRLDDRGVQTDLLRETADEQTSSTLVVNVQGEDRRFVHAFGANRRFQGDEVPADFAGARVLYLGGLFLMPTLRAERVAELFAAARRAGVTTVLDVVIADARGTWPALQQVLPHTDVFLPNHDEAVLVTGEHEPGRQAQQFAGAGAGTVVITLGGTGAWLHTPHGRWRSGVFSVPFVDGTGSGDAFAAGYICGLLEGAQPTDCLEMGAALGARCVMQPGATSGALTRGELATFLARQRLTMERVPERA